MPPEEQKTCGQKIKNTWQGAKQNPQKYVREAFYDLITIIQSAGLDAYTTDTLDKEVHIFNKAFSYAAVYLALNQLFPDLKTAITAPFLADVYQESNDYLKKQDETSIVSRLAHFIIQLPLTLAGGAVVLSIEHDIYGIANPSTLWQQLAIAGGCLIGNYASKPFFWLFEDNPRITYIKELLKNISRELRRYETYNSLSSIAAAGSYSLICTATASTLTPYIAKSNVTLAILFSQLLSLRDTANYPLSDKVKFFFLFPVSASFMTLLLAKLIANDNPRDFTENQLQQIVITTLSGLFCKIDIYHLYTALNNFFATLRLRLSSPLDKFIAPLLQQLSSIIMAITLSHRLGLTNLLNLDDTQALFITQGLSVLIHKLLNVVIPDAREKSDTMTVFHRSPRQYTMADSIRRSLAVIPSCAAATGAAVLGAALLREDKFAPTTFPDPFTELTTADGHLFLCRNLAAFIGGAWIERALTQFVTTTVNYPERRYVPKPCLAINRVIHAHILAEAKPIRRNTPTASSTYRLAITSLLIVASLLFAQTFTQTLPNTNYLLLVLVLATSFNTLFAHKLSWPYKAFDFSSNIIIGGSLGALATVAAGQTPIDKPSSTMVLPITAGIMVFNEAYKWGMRKKVEHLKPGKYSPSTPLASRGLFSRALSCLPYLQQQAMSEDDIHSGLLRREERSHTAINATIPPGYGSSD